MQKRIVKGKWLIAYELMEGVWRISDRGQDNMYLVVGNKKALVVDTGFGIEDLAAFVRRITPLPTVTVITHGHLDHAFGNEVFDEVYMGEPDMKDLTNADPSEMRAFFRNCRELLAEMKDFPKFTGSGSHAKKREIPIRDGLEFDLGDRKIKAYLTPGHSLGSVCFLDPKARVLFTGDAFVPNDTWGQAWYHGDGASLTVFYESMRKVMATGSFDWVCSGHGESGLIPVNHLEIFLDGIKGIIDGKIVGRPEHTFAGDGLRCDWEGSSLVYDPNKVK
jgi:hydroxyacylglutathione hydrolase